MSRMGGTQLQNSLRRLKGLMNQFNYAPRAELLQLPGLGGRKVDRILEARSHVGEGGMGLGDLVTVSGLGARLLARMTGEDPIILDLIKYAVYYQEITRGAKTKHPRDVVSVDLGLHNSACAHVDMDLQVLGWEKLHLRMPKPYSPEKCYEEVLESLRQLPEAEVYIIEVASQRPSVHKGGFLDISVQLKCLEAMYYSILRTVKEVPVLTIRPRMTSQYFDISLPQGRAKKQAAVNLVNDLISSSHAHTDADYCTVTPLGNRVHFSEELVRWFDGEKKKDDLSDCLLQAVGFLEWSKLSKETDT